MPPTVSAPLPRIETVWPSSWAVGTATSVARRTSSRASSGASAGRVLRRGRHRHAAGRARRRGDRGRQVGGERARRRHVRRPLGRLVQVLEGRVRPQAVVQQLRPEFPLRLAMHLVSGECQARQDHPVHQQAQSQRGQFDIEPAAGPSRQPGKPRLQPPQHLTDHGPGSCAILPRSPVPRLSAARLRLRRHAFSQSIRYGANDGS